MSGDKEKTKLINRSDQKQGKISLKNYFLIKFCHVFCDTTSSLIEWNLARPFICYETTILSGWENFLIVLEPMIKKN